MDIRELCILYKSVVGTDPEQVVELSGAGSNRRYYRLTGQLKCIGVAGTSTDENRAFVTLSRHFEGQGLFVPHIFGVSEDEKYYIQEDLGDTLLFDAISEGRSSGHFSLRECALLKQTIRQLPVFQYKGAEGLDFSVCYPQPSFDRRTVMWDLNYFKYCFLKATGVDFREDLLENDFERMADELLREECSTFMIRDFQSRNVMVRDDKIYFIDYQGGRRGPYYYDVASFLWQAKARFPQGLRDELITDYVDALQAYVPVDASVFRVRLRYFVLFRTLQVLGAYGFRGYFERKEHFLQSVPSAINNLRDLLKEDFLEFPYLCEVLRKMAEQSQFEEKEPRPVLEVEVSSFSYKKGIPEDTSGNGGGFVFDCRAIHNPGRYEQYKSLTGLDKPVRDFLEVDGEIAIFLAHACALVDASVERYIKRGFTHLSVHFGCTGGQHRSVYSAQYLADHLHEKYGVRVNLTHREQKIHKIYPQK